MLDKFDQYLPSAFVNFAGLILGIVGIILACVFYLKAKKDKEPCWAIQTVNLIRDYSVGLGGLEVLYAGEKVKNLSISKLLFWNHGSLTIDRNDIADANPLRIYADQRDSPANQINRFLDVKLLSQNNSASQVVVSLSPDKSNAQFVFDYLDQGHGFVVQIVHEGTSSKDIALRGSIKGAKAIIRIDPDPFLYKPKVARTYAVISRSINMTVSLLMASLILWMAWTEPTGWVGKGFLAFFGVFFFVGSVLGVREIQKLLRLRAPQGLDVFYDDPRQSLMKRD